MINTEDIISEYNQDDRKAIVYYRYVKDPHAVYDKYMVLYEDGGDKKHKETFRNIDEAEAAAEDFVLASRQ